MTPYRINAPPPPEPKEPEPKVPFNKKYPKLYNVVMWFVGAGVSAVGLYGLFPGVYKFGSLFHGPCDSVGRVDHFVVQWLTGLGVLSIPILFFFLSKFVGCVIKSNIERIKEDRKRSSLYNQGD